MLKHLKLLIASACVLSMGSAAQAELVPISPTAAGAIATAPWMAGDDSITVVTVTNGSTDFKNYHVTILSDIWTGYDFDCALSPMETTYFVFESSSNPDESDVTSECSSYEGVRNLEIIRTRRVPRSEGFMVLQELNTNGSASATNSLISDFTVVNFAMGYAFSANSWHVRSRRLTRNADDHNLWFGREYAPLPGTLATSFIAPDDDVTASVLLYNLNGEPGGPAPAVLSGRLYDDDENGLSGFVNYDCFELISLQQIFGSNALRTFGPAGPYRVGHVVLQARTTPGRFDPRGESDAPVPSVGWVIQTLADGGSIDGFGSPAQGDAAWARQMLVTYDPLHAFFWADAIPRR